MGFHNGNKEDGKHYWLTPPELLNELNNEFHFDFDPCPFPKPEDFDGLTCEWGESSYVNPPFGSIIHQGPNDKKPKKKGPTAWARKAIEEYQKGKKVVLVYPIDKWILMLLEHAKEVRNLKDVKWCATEDGSPGKGTGRHIACFVLDPKKEKANFEEWWDKQDKDQFFVTKEEMLFSMDEYCIDRVAESAWKAALKNKKQKAVFEADLILSRLGQLVAFGASKLELSIAIKREIEKRDKECQKQKA